MELGWAYPKRKELIKKYNSSISADQPKYPLNFKGERTFFPIFKVSIEMPKYRLANGRTQDAQEELIVKNELPEDFFDRDDESEEAHKLQHEILKEQLKSGEIDLIAYFKKNKQEEPLVLDHRGFVVNGNRRLRAMRDIYQSDLKSEKPDPRFKYIEVILLPPAEEEAILALEGKLQISKDIKADYSWTAEGCMYRSLRDKRGFTTEKIASIYEDKKKEDVEELILLLTYVDQYLVSRGIPKQYHEIAKEKFAFEAIVKSRKKMGDNIEKKELFQTLAFNAIETKPAGIGRLHTYIPKIAENLDQILEASKKTFPSEETKAEKEDFTEGLLGELEPEAELENLITIIDQEENKESVAHLIKDAIDAEEERQQKFTVIQKIQRANTLLKDALNAFDEDIETDGIDAQIDSIENYILELKEKLENVRN